jgi:hypothetical protein
MPMARPNPVHPVKNPAEDWRPGDSESLDDDVKERGLLQGLAGRQALAKTCLYQPQRQEGAHHRHVGAGDDGSRVGQGNAGIPGRVQPDAHRGQQRLPFADLGRRPRLEPDHEYRSQGDAHTRHAPESEAAGPQRADAAVHEELRQAADQPGHRGDPEAVEEARGPDRPATEAIRHRAGRSDEQEHDDLLNDGQRAREGALLVQRDLQDLVEDLRLHHADRVHHRDAEERDEKQRTGVPGTHPGAHPERTDPDAGLLVSGRAGAGNVH